jgi:hypothetical protein
MFMAMNTDTETSRDMDTRKDLSDYGLWIIGQSFFFLTIRPQEKKIRLWDRLSRKTIRYRIELKLSEFRYRMLNFNITVGYPALIVFFLQGKEECTE